jgi:S1-C subfamily serine protease
MSAITPSSILEQFSAALVGAVAGAAAGVLGIRAGRDTASGFIWRAGLVVTAAEALPEEGEMSVLLPGGEALRAKPVGRDPSTDIALLRPDRELAAPVSLQHAPPPVGSLVQLIGAQDGAPLAAIGSVARSGPAWRSLRGGAIDARIELDVALRPQAEGGLVLDAAGRAVGMAVFGPRRRVLVIPAATIERVAATLAEHGRVARGYLGLQLQPVRLDGGAGMGAMVMAVDASGPGAAAGIRQGDVITAWDGKPIEGVRALLRALGPASVGSRVRLTLSRGGAPLLAEVGIGERPTA